MQNSDNEDATYITGATGSIWKFDFTALSTMTKPVQYNLQGAERLAYIRTATGNGNEQWRLTIDNCQDVCQVQFSTCLLTDSCPPQHHTT